MCACVVVFFSIFSFVWQEKSDEFIEDIAAGLAEEERRRLSGASHSQPVSLTDKEAFDRSRRHPPRRSVTRARWFAARLAWSPVRIVADKSACSSGCS